VAYIVATMSLAIILLKYVIAYATVDRIVSTALDETQKLLFAIPGNQSERLASPEHAKHQRDKGADQMTLQARSDLCCKATLQSTEDSLVHMRKQMCKASHLY